MRFSEIRGRADNYQSILNQVWERLWPLLSKAQAEADVVKAFQEGANPYAQQFVPVWSSLILEILHDRKFPKRRQAQINFLADSLAGLGRICSAQLPRYLHSRASESEARPPYYSLRILCRMLLRL